MRHPCLHAHRRVAEQRLERRALKVVSARADQIVQLEHAVRLPPLEAKAEEGVAALVGTDALAAHRRAARLAEPRRDFPKRVRRARQRECGAEVGAARVGRERSERLAHIRDRDRRVAGGGVDGAADRVILADALGEAVVVLEEEREADDGEVQRRRRRGGDGGDPALDFFELLAEDGVGELGGRDAHDDELRDAGGRRLPRGAQRRRHALVVAGSDDDEHIEAAHPFGRRRAFDLVRTARHLSADGADAARRREGVRVARAGENFARAAGVALDDPVQRRLPDVAARAEHEHAAPPAERRRRRRRYPRGRIGRGGPPPPAPERRRRAPPTSSATEPRPIISVNFELMRRPSVAGGGATGSAAKRRIACCHSDDSSAVSPDRMYFSFSPTCPVTARLSRKACGRVGRAVFGFHTLQPPSRIVSSSRGLEVPTTSE